MESSRDDLTIPIQSGSGLSSNPSEDVIKQLADAVTERVTQQISKTWQTYNLTQPQTAEVESEDTSAPLPYNNEVKKNDLNDVFDEKQLLKLVPARYKHKAQILLKQFDNHPNEITWSPDGSILIDQVSLPQSDIYLLFPLLFQKSSNPSKIAGFDDFVAKIKEMGLDHLTNSRITKSLKVVKKSIEPQTLKNSDSKNWWYIGP